MVQLNLNLAEHMYGIGPAQDIFHYTCMQACMINDVKPIVQSSCICTRRVHGSIQMYTPNLDYVHPNCKPRTVE